MSADAPAPTTQPAAEVKLVPADAQVASVKQEAPEPAHTTPEPELIADLRDWEERTGRRSLIYTDNHLTGIILFAALATDENLRALPAAAPELKYLRISGSWSRISPESLAELGRLKHLEKLEFRYANRQMSIEYGMALSHCQSLKTLSISGCELDSGMIGFLATLPNLTTLQLRSTRELTDAYAFALAGLPTVEELDLSYTRISDAALDLLATMPGLKRLNVTGTRVTEEGVQSSGLLGKAQVKGAKPPPPPPDQPDQS